MKTLKIDLDRDIEELKILPISDVHLGDPLCDKELLRNRIEYIKNNKDVYTILNGDLMNIALKNSVSDVYGEKLKPMKQLEKASEFFYPIKDKILCITDGNHEARIYKNDGIDLTKLLAMELDLKERYSQSSCFIFLRFGQKYNGHKESNGSGKIRKICYTIYTIHGRGGGRKEGAKAIRLADMASIVDADIYIHSHTHLPMIMKQEYYRVDNQNNYIASVPKLFVNTAAHLNYGGYGEIYEYKPSSKDTPIIYLNGKKKEFNARL